MPLKRIALIVIASFMLFSCTRKTIEFGMIPENSYTDLSYIDSVGFRLTTLVADSFITSGATTLLVGRYSDPYLGTVSASSFFEIDKPETLPEIPTTAVFDSLVFIARTNKYYYGDTATQQTLYLNELDSRIEPTYSTYLFNTTTIPVKTPALAADVFYLRPIATDSIAVRLSDSKGLEIYQKIKDKATELTSTENFQNYFKGIRLSVNSSDTTAIFGLKNESGNIVMRLYYHHTTPYKENFYVDFPALVNDHAFNQVLSNRTGTGIVSGNSSLTALPSSQTKDFSFSQPGTGMTLKIGFPSLKGIQLTENYVKLLRAELILRPASLSYTDNIKLPDSLYLVTTDGSNIAGNALHDSSGQYTMYATPVIDKLYGVNTYYRFNISSYISQLLANSSAEDDGLFVMQPYTSSSPHVTRLVLENKFQGNYNSELRLSVLIIKK